MCCHVNTVKYIQFQKITINKFEKSGEQRQGGQNVQINDIPQQSFITDYSGSRRSSQTGLKAEKDIFTGTYYFDKYDEGLEEYLDSLGLSGSELGQIVRNAKIRITLKKPLEPDTKWTLTTYETGNT